MGLKITKGIELLGEVQGDGAIAEKGSVVIYNARFFLRRGDEVTFDARSIAAYSNRLTTRNIDGVELIDHKTTLGNREPIAGVEKTLYGMQPGGYREVQVSPHLAYRDVGISEVIPPNALLRINLWVHEVQNAT